MATLRTNLIIRCHVFSRPSETIRNHWAYKKRNEMQIWNTSHIFFANVSIIFRSNTQNIWRTSAGSPRASPRSQTWDLAPRCWSPAVKLSPTNAWIFDELMIGAVLHDSSIEMIQGHKNELHRRDAWLFTMNYLSVIKHMAIKNHLQMDGAMGTQRIHGVNFHCYVWWRKSAHDW